MRSYFGASQSMAGISLLLVDIPPVSQGNQVQFIIPGIELVNHSVIAHAETVGVLAFHVIVGEAAQPSSHVVYFFLHSPLDIWGQREKPLIKPVGTNLGRCASPRVIHGRRMRTRPALISAFPAAISCLKASVISRRSSSRFSSQSRNSSWSRCCNFRTASSICSRLLTWKNVKRHEIDVN